MSDDPKGGDNSGASAQSSDSQTSAKPVMLQPDPGCRLENTGRLTTFSNEPLTSKQVEQILNENGERGVGGED